MLILKQHKIKPGSNIAHDGCGGQLQFVEVEGCFSGSVRSSIIDAILKIIQLLTITINNTITIIVFKWVVTGKGDE